MELQTSFPSHSSLSLMDKAKTCKGLWTCILFTNLIDFQTIYRFRLATIKALRLTLSVSCRNVFQSGFMQRRRQQPLQQLCQLWQWFRCPLRPVCAGRRPHRSGHRHDRVDRHPHGRRGRWRLHPQKGQLFHLDAQRQH